MSGTGCGCWVVKGCWAEAYCDRNEEGGAGDDKWPKGQHALVSKQSTYGYLAADLYSDYPLPPHSCSPTDLASSSRAMWSRRTDPSCWADLHLGQGPV